MGLFSDGTVGGVIDNSIGPTLAIAFNDASKGALSSTVVRWSFVWQGLPARVTLGGSGFSNTADIDGTVTSFTFKVDGATIYSLRDISVARLSIAELVHANNGAGLLALLYSGNDTFKLTHAGAKYALYGAGGNDTFNFSDKLTADDIVVGGAGTDTVSLSGGYTLSLTATTMGDVEILKLASGSSYEITFTDANVASGARLTISAANLGAGDGLIVDGSSETDGQFTVKAGASGDDIIGGARGDILNGGAGADTVAGGAGADALNGGAGADMLRGQAGHDTLTGGADDDKFLFSQFGTSSSDTIADFSSMQADKILLEKSAFTALGTATGALVAAKFWVGETAHDADDRIIYNSATGKLYYDNDGSGVHAQLLIATLSTHPTLVASDIVVI